MVVNVERDIYRKILQRYNFDMYPRTVGFPVQRFIGEFKDFWKFFDFTRGENTCFTSTQSYPKLAMSNNKVKPISISMNNIFSDFDESTKPENALRDCRNMTNFLINENIPFINNYSGSKGFANYIILKPQTYKYIASQDSGKSLKLLIYGVHLFFEKKFKMTTMDKKVMKDPKRLCRMPYSPHCNRENYLSGRHCYPLTMEQSLKWQIKEITDYAYNPEVIIPEVQGKMMTLTQLVDYLNVDFEQVEQEIEFAPTNRKDVGQIQDDETQLLLCMLDKMKPCIANNLRTINPDHDMRFAFAVWMKRLGKTREDAERHYVNIGKHFGYVDLHNEDERRVQFDNIFNNDYKYEPSCNTIIRNGFCIAEKCDRFHSAWKGHEHKRLATK